MITIFERYSSLPNAKFIALLTTFHQEPKIALFDFTNSRIFLLGGEKLNLVDWEKFDVVGYDVDLLLDFLQGHNQPLPSIKYDARVVAKISARSDESVSIPPVESHKFKSFLVNLYYNYKEFHTLSLSLRKLCEFECSMLPYYTKISFNGLSLDKDELKDYLSNLDGLIQQQFNEIQALTSEDFNPNDARQLTRLFYGDLKFAPAEYTQSGSPSLSQRAIKDFLQNKIVAKIADYRNALVFATGRDCLQRYTTDIGVLHPTLRGTSFDGSLALTTTCPSVSQFPNKVRSFVKPSAGNKFVEITLEHPELTLMFQQARIPVSSRRDLHTHIFKQIFPAIKIDRAIKKRVVFSLLYDFRDYNYNANLISKLLSIDLSRAMSGVRLFESDFKSILTFKSKVVSDSLSKGYLSYPGSMSKRLRRSLSQQATKRGLFSVYLRDAVSIYFKKCLKSLMDSDIDVRIVFVDFDKFLIELGKTKRQSDILKKMRKLFKPFSLRYTTLTKGWK